LTKALSLASAASGAPSRAKLRTMYDSYRECGKPCSKNQAASVPPSGEPADPSSSSYATSMAARSSASFVALRSHGTMERSGAHVSLPRSRRQTPVQLTIRLSSSSSAAILWMLATVSTLAVRTSSSSPVRPAT